MPQPLPLLLLPAAEPSRSALRPLPAAAAGPSDQAPAEAHHAEQMHHAAAVVAGLRAFTADGDAR